jgi:hypothetical protein
MEAILISHLNTNCLNVRFYHVSISSSLSGLRTLSGAGLLCDAQVANGVSVILEVNNVSGKPAFANSFFFFEFPSLQETVARRRSEAKIFF